MSLHDDIAQAMSTYSVRLCGTADAAGAYVVTHRDEPDPVKQHAGRHRDKATAETEARRMNTNAVLTAIAAWVETPRNHDDIGDLADLLRQERR